MQIHSKPVFFNQGSNGESISKILESSLDKLDEEDIAENVSIKEKILDSLNDPIHEHEEEFINMQMNQIDEHEEYNCKQAKNLQKEINNQGYKMNRRLDDSYEEIIQNVDESDAYSISQKLILLGSNIKPKKQLKEEDSYYLSPQLKTPGQKMRNLENPKQIQSTSLHNQHVMQTQNLKARYLSPDSSQKNPVQNLQNGNFQRKNELEQKVAQQLIGQRNGLQHKSPTAASQNQRVLSKNKTPEKNKISLTTARDHIRENSQSKKSQQQNPSENQNGATQSSSKKKIEKYYIQQVERQNDLVSQQQKQIIQYQQQLQQQTLEFQLFMQEQQLLSQQNYFQQQQQLMLQQRNSANILLQQPPAAPFYPYLTSPQANPLFSFNPLNSPLVMSTQNPTQGNGFIPQVPPPIIINNNIQKKDFGENDQNGQNNINNNMSNLNGSMSSQLQQRAFLTSNKNESHSMQSPYYDKGGDETLTPAGQQGTADHSQIERQTEQLFRNNNNNSSFGGNLAKKNSSQRRKWDIGQKTCTQSELSADEDYLTSYNREVKQPRQFDPNPQLYLPSQQTFQQQQQQQPQQVIQYKKPVKFDIFWERKEIEQENKENQRNNSIKRVNNINEENKLESTIQKQYKSAIDQAENTQTNPANNQRSLQDIFVSKKTDLQRKLEYEKNSQVQVMSYRNQSPDLSKEDLIQIRKDLLKPKAQQIIQSINFDSQNNSHSQSHFQSQFSHNISNLSVPMSNLQNQLKPIPSQTQVIQKPVIQTSSIQLSQQSTLQTQQQPSLLATQLPTGSNQQYSSIQIPQIPSTSTQMPSMMQVHQQPQIQIQSQQQQQQQHLTQVLQPYQLTQHQQPSQLQQFQQYSITSN